MQNNKQQVWLHKPPPPPPPQPQQIPFESHNMLLETIGIFAASLLRGNVNLSAQGRKWKVSLKLLFHRFSIPPCSLISHSLPRPIASPRPRLCQLPFRMSYPPAPPALFACPELPSCCRLRHGRCC